MIKKYFLILFLLTCFFGFSQTQDAVQLYPNPFKDKVTIKVSKKVQQIKVYDVLGKQIVASNDIEKIKKLLLKLRSGIYLLQVIDEKGNLETKKIVKQ